MRIDDPRFEDTLSSSRSDSPTPPPLPPNAASMGDDDQVVPYGAAPPVQRGALPLPDQDENFVQRWRRQVSQAYRLRVAARETPCWLASMVLHATVMVIMGSLASSRSQNNRWAPVVITLASFEQDRGMELEPLALLRGDSQPRHGEKEASATAGSNPFLEELQQIEKDVAALLAENEQVVPELGDIAEELEAPADRGRGAEPEMRELIAPRQTATKNSRRQAGSPDEQRGFDGIVEQFIQYDVGRLPGPRGEKARQDFAALGPEAIPALVRGLNRAAMISASCPIGVISSKLDAQLSKTTDPEMLRYALDNMGRGVSRQAPHRRRIDGLVQQWRSRFGGHPEDLAMRNAQEAAIKQTNAAKSLLWMAQSLQAAGKYDSAIQRYLAVVQRYPNTRAARIARKELETLQRKRNPRFAEVSQN